MKKQMGNKKGNASVRQQSLQEKLWWRAGWIARKNPNPRIESAKTEKALDV
uniref:hypothetical protein n=1 Tax=Thiolapillus sp. TaxID=2017437 RepID=UPI003AF91293